jgi:carboxypeptidase PM20D1
VVPALSTAVVNHRIHPSQNVADVLEFDRRIINDPRVNLRIKMSREALPITPYGPEDVHYQLIATSITQTFENVIVVPST